MAETVELPVDVSNWDRLVGSINASTQASKQAGEAFKKAFLAEVAVQGAQRLASSLGGVEGAAVSAAGALVQGFAAGGPIGAVAIGGIAILDMALDHTKKSLQELEAITTRIALERVEQARQIRVSQERALSELESSALTDTDQFVKSEAERRRAAREAAERRNQESIDLAEIGIVAEFERRRIVQAREERELADFIAETQRAIDADIAERRRASLASIDAAQAREADQREREALQARVDAVGDGLLDGLVASAERQSAEVGAVVSAGIAPAVAALTAMDAAQIAAAASAGDLGSILAEVALAGLSQRLQAIAQEEAVLALAATAKGVGAAIFNPAAAAGFFTEAGLHAAAAVAAGGGAVAVNTAATAVRPPGVPASGDDRPTRGRADGGTGGTVINVSTGQLFATEDAVGAAVERARRQAARYGRV